MDKNFIIMFTLQCIFHCLLAVCGTYLIVNEHVSCGIFVYILIWLTTYSYNGSSKKEDKKKPEILNNNKKE